VHYPDGVSGDPIEDLVTMAGKQCDADARPPDDSAATQWRYGYPCNDLLMRCAILSAIAE
jgi:hypothetical protein